MLPPAKQGQQALGQPARGGQRLDVYPRHRLPVARDPKDLAARSTVYDYFDRWHWDGTLRRIHYALYIKCREEASREASQRQRSSMHRASKAQRRAAHTSIRMGMTRARRSKARSGMCWSTRKVCCCMPSSLLRISRIVTAGRGCWVTSVSIPPAEAYADGGYQGPNRASVKAVLSQVDVEIVRRSDQAKGFVVLPNAGWSREHWRLTLPSVEQGLGEPEPQGAGVPAHGFHSLHGQKAMPGRMLRQDGWLVANIKGPNIECRNINVPWFVLPGIACLIEA